MADAVTGNYISSTDQIAENYKKYADLYKDSDENMINVDTFLNLLVAEMKNQDPLEPTSNTEFISQLATFSSLQSMENSSYYSNATYASSLVGKTVTVASYSGTDYNTETGVVTSIELSGKSFTLKVNGKEFKLSAIQSVQPNGSTTTTDSASSASDSNYAATLIGMYATVQAKDSNGQTVVDEGIVKSYEVKDGSVKIIINDIAYKLDDIVKVRYAVDGDIKSDSEEIEETNELAADNTNSSELSDIEDIVDEYDDVEDVVSTLFEMAENGEI